MSPGGGEGRGGVGGKFGSKTQKEGGGTRAKRKREGRQGGGGGGGGDTHSQRVTNLDNELTLLLVLYTQKCRNAWASKRTAPKQTDAQL